MSKNEKKYPTRHKERILDKLERMGLKDLRKHVVFEHFWTPLDIRAQYNSNRGSIYGVVSDRWKNLAFKAPKQSALYPNLFFVGGSVNPGGGVPMVVPLRAECGQESRGVGPGHAVAVKSTHMLSANLNSRL